MSWQAILAELVQRRVGISMRLDTGSVFVDRFVRSRTKALALDGAVAYVSLLERSSFDDAEWIKLIGVMSNGQTAFFRDSTQLEIVGEVMTEIAAVRGRPLSVWSAGCSTGEEVYSLAMLAHDRGVKATILGSDINADFLRFAERGRYGSWALRRMEDRWRVRYLRSEGAEHVVCDEIRRFVQFLRHNLLEPSTPSAPRAGGFDVILCRNVFIYFDQVTVRRVLERMTERLANDGGIFLGASEGLMADVPGLCATEQGGRIVYRRSDGVPVLRLHRAPSTRPPAPPARVMAPTLLEIDSWPPAPPDGGVPELYDQALGCIDDGDLERASQLLDELLNSNPDHLLGRITHGNVLLGLHRFDEAASRYAEAHAREPLMAEIHYFQGLVFRKTGQLEQAAAAFRRAVFLDDGFWPAAYQHASALRRLGRLERSRAELKHTLRALESGATSPFRSHVAGLFGLGAPAERVAEACRRELARDRSLWD